jgi:hypothetical protein
MHVGCVRDEACACAMRMWATCFFYFASVYHRLFEVESLREKTNGA